MRILLLGKDGQVGWELQRALAPLGKVVALGRGGTSTATADLALPELLGETVRSVAPDVIVNAAAYTAVDKAETEPDLARTINATAPGRLARAAAEIGAWLVHYSTDYVFDGSGSAAWTEDSPTGPLNVYGQTKLEGENLIRASGCRHLIFRTSWVYAARGHNFARTMLRLASERESLNVVDDQFGAPTGAELIADVTAHALRITDAKPGLSGLYHLAAAGETSWFDYARHVIEHARQAGAHVKVPPDGVRAVPTTSFPTTARRPANSRLDCSRVQRAFSLDLARWEFGVERVVAELLQR